MIDGSMVEVRTNPAAAILHVALLGSPKVRWRDQSLVVPRRQLRALLYRLVAADEPVSREHVCFLLWPDVSDTTARRNLTVLLNHLRRVLPVPAAVLAVDGTLSVQRSLIWSDAQAFIETRATALRERRVDLLDAVVHLYRGSFLSGFTVPDSPEFAEWIERERHVWERRYLETLSLLVEVYTDLRDFPAAIGAAQRYLAADPSAEEMHRRLIMLYGAVGDRGAALRQFERCILALKRDLGLDPLPETQAVYEAVRDGAPLTLLSGAPRPAAGRAWHAPLQMPPAKFRWRL